MIRSILFWRIEIGVNNRSVLFYCLRGGKGSTIANREQEIVKISWKGMRRWWSFGSPAIFYIALFLHSGKFLFNPRRSIVTAIYRNTQDDRHSSSLEKVSPEQCFFSGVNENHKRDDAIGNYGPNPMWFCCLEDGLIPNIPKLLTQIANRDSGS